MSIPVVEGVTDVGSEILLQDNVESLEEVFEKNVKLVSCSVSKQTGTRDTSGEAARDCLSSRFGHSLMVNRGRNLWC